MNKELNAINPTKYIGRALDKYNDELIGALSNGLLCVRESRRTNVRFNMNAQTGIVRLMEVYCVLCQPEPDTVVEGYDNEVLELLLSRILSHVLLHPVTGWEGLALCVELANMMDDLIEGDWFA